jgi:hypothetical protein
LGKALAELEVRTDHLIGNQAMGSSVSALPLAGSPGHLWRGDPVPCTSKNESVLSSDACSDPLMVFSSANRKSMVISFVIRWFSKKPFSRYEHTETISVYSSFRIPIESGVGDPNSMPYCGNFLENAKKYMGMVPLNIRWCATVW